VEPSGRVSVTTDQSPPVADHLEGSGKPWGPAKSSKNSKTADPFDAAAAWGFPYSMRSVVPEGDRLGTRTQRTAVSLAAFQDSIQKGICVVPSARVKRTSEPSGLALLKSKELSRATRTWKLLRLAPEGLLTATAL